MEIIRMTFGSFFVIIWGIVICHSVVTSLSSKQTHFFPNNQFEGEGEGNLVIF